MSPTSYRTAPPRVMVRNFECNTVLRYTRGSLSSSLARADLRRDGRHRKLAAVRRRWFTLTRTEGHALTRAEGAARSRIDGLALSGAEGRVEGHANFRIDLPIARRELGLIKPGEHLFIIRDVPPAGEGPEDGK